MRRLVARGHGAALVELTTMGRLARLQYAEAMSYDVAVGML